MVPVFTWNRSARSAPSSAPAASPWLRRRHSPWPLARRRKPVSESTPAKERRSCTATRPISTRFEPVTRLQSFTTGSSRVPSGLACRTQLVWQSRAAPSLSALLPSSPAPPGSDCAQLPPDCCDSQARRSLTSLDSTSLTAHYDIVVAEVTAPDNDLSPDPPA